MNCNRDATDDGFTFRLPAHSLVILPMTNEKAYLRRNRDSKLDVTFRPPSSPIGLKDSQYATRLSPDGNRRDDRRGGSRSAERTGLRGRQRCAGVFDDYGLKRAKGFAGCRQEVERRRQSL